MELFDNIMLGLSTALAWNNLLWCIIGVSLGVDRRDPGRQDPGDHVAAVSDHLRAGTYCRVDHAGWHLVWQPPTADR